MNRRRGRSRLNRFISLPGGLTEEVALARAHTNLEAHRTAALEAVDAAIEAMGVLAGDCAAKPAARTRLHEMAYEIASMAGLYNLVALGIAAQSLCDLIEGCRLRGAWDVAGVGVHLGAIRLLRRPEHAVGAAEGEILSGLARIVKREALASA